MTKAARSVRVLIVEDNPADAEILTEVLNAQGATRFDVEWVEYVRDGEERVARLPRVDVAIVDLKLPDADGLEALDRIHRSAPTLPVFVMTGFDDEALAQESKRRGACGYLVKGKFGAAHLCTLITDAIGNAATKRAAAAG